ncbi:carbohydate-binding domain-containing protein [Shewanella schlegeliana]|uniref:beta-N-acetylhexosaminidase n=1 Tax=Shewanella schlegeliana TaxID=190308 RepID=A0ABS1SU84_9GAMM|nr:family 20 glycosylhydrolase [Shewanella schlegeliana]MBL4912117.1 carbohydate-binding domain-containing protein [Shewanella schlegeliana]MCL1110797.1 carbohydate-binding domain-containing protein [Shewanella schlegeliana]GIU22970.1 beta-N-acetylhexosaminidase [Shewanella schlegeliana]
MKIKVIVSAVALALSVGACSKQNETEEVTSVISPTEQGSQFGQVVSPSSLTQATLKQIGETLDIEYRVVTNVPDDSCDQEAADGRCFLAEIDLTSQVDIDSKDWAIYYSQMRPIQSVVGDEFSITRIQGDLHKITPAAGFSGFKKGQTKTIQFRGELWQLSETDAMPNYYIVVDGLEPVIIASTQVSIDPETGMEVRPYVSAFTDSDSQYKRRETDKLEWATTEVLYRNNLNTPVDASLAENTILPTPSKVSLKTDAKPVSLKDGIKLELNGVSLEAVDAALQRLARIGVSQSDAGTDSELDSGVSTALLPLIAPSAKGEYRLEISNNGIKVFAADDAGFSYGLASLAALVDANTLTVNPMLVEDAPRYDFRGMHIDVSRNFHSKQLILDLLDQMAAYKLNKLHLHMADDEGWRLEIAGLPELTQVGSKRCHDLNEDTCLLPQLGSGPFSDTKVNGYYSRADYIEILQYAAARQIQVIPSMDMPGHSRAAIKSMEARARKLISQGKVEAAKQYQLSDSQDKTVYSSIQYYNDNTLNVCMESTFTFIDKVIDEIAKMHQDAGVPLNLYHIGADETAGAWLESPVCKAFIANNDKGVTSMDELGAYFIERTARMLADKGIEAAGWSDGMSHTRAQNMPKQAQSNIWDVIAHGGHKRAHQQANLGWQAVLGQPEVLYFDFPYEADPKEHGYYWASRNTNSQKIHSFMSGNLPANAEQWTDIEALPFEADDTVKTDETGKIVSEPLKATFSFAGIQGQLWSETVRSDDVAEYMMFPRLMMLAERAWHKPSWEVPYQYQGAVYNQNSGFFTKEMRQAQARDWHTVANTIGAKELLKLDKANIAYRVPTPGAVIKDGKLFANVIFPGLEIEYRDAGGQWQAYAEGVAVTAPVEVRVIAADGKRKGRTLVVE